ncbi:MAG: hypothetical protein SFY66_13865 [Oculatellaceae cyanobacterium bins.114]|nr:hypothetical protein [Oculatellaceae cyanobacterium bins.114]
MGRRIDRDMTDRDEHLRSLIETVQQQPPKSLPWRKAMHRLLLEVQQLPGLARSPHPDYAEALDDALLRLGDAIKTFEPRQPSLEKSLTAWINLKLRLKYEVRELHAPPRSRSLSATRNPQIEFKQQAQKPPLSLDAPLDATGGTSFGDQLPAAGAFTLWDLEEKIQQEQEQHRTIRIGVQLQKYIETDPERQLQKCHPQAHPDCHCQMLSQRLLLKHPPDRLSAIAREFNINYHTLNWHWKNRGLPLLQDIAKKMGYQPDRTI